MCRTVRKGEIKHPKLKKALPMCVLQEEQEGDPCLQPLLQGAWVGDWKEADEMVKPNEEDYGTRV